MKRPGRWALLLQLLAMALLGAGGSPAGAGPPEESAPEAWSQRPPADWPQISMINEIQYVDQHHPVAGCAFLLDVGSDTLAVTAKHILTYFKSSAMSSVAFGGSLKLWKMYPKNNPDDVVLIDSLINADADEGIDRVACAADWLLFNTGAVSANIQPLKPRYTPLIPGESVFIVGWRYTDKDCPQVIYKGAYVRSEGATHLISTERLTDNRMPGLSGSPVIDSRGRVIGLMSQKAGPLERLSSTTYPLEVVGRSRAAKGSSGP